MPYSKPRVYSVKSFVSKKTYTVVLKNGLYFCTCPVSKFKKQQCKHILAVREKYEAKIGEEQRESFGARISEEA